MDPLQEDVVEPTKSDARLLIVTVNTQTDWNSKL